MKRDIVNVLLLLAGLTLSNSLVALGLGEITLKSALNQPLVAELELHGTEGFSKWEIKPRLASAADFERAGVERFYFLTQIQFKVEDKRVLLTSKDPVTEPFLNFLVELNWPSGRVLREYTVLLDPPVFAEEQKAIGTQTPEGGSTDHNPPAFMQESEDELSSQVRPKPHQKWLNTGAENGIYKVQPNDTLWQIALETRPDHSITAQQMMLAIQKQNPGAFINGNINRIKTHQILRIPDAGEIASISFSQAIREVDRQNKALAIAGAQIDATGLDTQVIPGAEAKGRGEVRLLSSTAEDASVASSSGDISKGQGSGKQQALENDLAIALESLDKSRLENQDLQKRLQALEEQINTLQSLITLKDDQLTSLQLGKKPATEAEVTDNAESGQPTDNESLNTEASVDSDRQDSDPAQVAGEQPSADKNGKETSATSDQQDFNFDSPADTDADNAETVENTDDAVANNGDTLVNETSASATDSEASVPKEKTSENLLPAPEPEAGLIDQLLQKPEWMGGIAALLLLLSLAGYKVWQKRQLQQEDFFDEELMDDLIDEDIEFEDDELDLADNEFDTGNPELENNTDVAEEASDDFDDIEQTGDVLGEADIHIVYGNFDQAIAILLPAIEQEPDRPDLRLKLLEVHAEMDDSDAFAHQEAALIAMGDQMAVEQAKALRLRLSSPADPATAGLNDTEEPASDRAMDNALAGAGELDSEFADGLDFEAALDLSDDTGVDSSSLSDEDLAAVLDDVPTLDVDHALDVDANDGLDFDLDIGESSAPQEEVAEVATPAEPDVATDDDMLEFDLSSFDQKDTDAEVESEPEVTLDLSEESAGDLDFDLDDSLALDTNTSSSSDLEEVVLEDSFDLSEDDLTVESGDIPNLGVDDEVVLEEPDIEATDDTTDDTTESMSELERLMDNGTEANLSLDVSEEVEQPQELSTGTDTPAPEEAGEETSATMDFAADLAELDDELGDFELPVMNDEVKVPPAVAMTEEPQLAPVMDDVVDNTSSDDEIDLDELAKSDDEFEFLAGTDECTTKLDLARAYIDMEDSNGARELLQEVIQEGNDQQKQEARSLMDNLS